MKDYKTLWLIIVMLLTFSVIAVLANKGITEKYNQAQKQLTKEVHADINVYEVNYNYVLLYIMYSEDLLQKPFNKLTGQSLVGFGHTVKKGENFCNMNYRKSFDLLQVDYCKCIDLAIDAGFSNLDNRQLAVALMFYNMKPQSVKKILSNMDNIEKYIYYTKGDTSRISDNLINNRAFEKELYESEGIVNIYKYF
jgi:hypothetical protein